jgi:ubiquinone biosynthesis protein
VQAPASAARRRLGSPESVRKLLERLGPVFIKVGQSLALRPDIIDQEYCDELLRLTDHVEPFPFSEAQRVLIEDLGPIEKHFEWVRPRPLASASIGQVHLARTLDGADVAIKIKRPDIDARAERDLRRLRRIARVLETAGVLRVVSPKEIAEELTRWLREELDFEHELSNMLRMYNLARRAPSLVIPRPYPELSSKRIITADFVSGIPLSAVLRQVREGRRDEVLRLGLDPDQLAESLIEEVLRQIFDLEVFHADVHPGNLIALPGNRIAFVDFGLTDTLDPKFGKSVLVYLTAVYDDDVDGMFRALTELLKPSEDTDLDRFRADFEAETREYQRRRDANLPRRAPGARSPVGSYLVGVVRAARRNHLAIPTSVLSMYRVLLTSETIAGQLSDVVDLREIGRRFLRDLQSKRVFDALRPEALRPTALESLALLRDGPGQARKLLSDLAEGRFILNVRSAEAESEARHANDRAKLIAGAIASVGLTALITSPETRTFGGFDALPILWVLLGGSWALLAFLWRRMR